MTTSIISTSYARDRSYKLNERRESVCVQLIAKFQYNLHQLLSRLFRAKVQSGRLRLQHEPTSLILKPLSIGVLVFLRQEETPRRWELVNADGCVHTLQYVCHYVELFEQLQCA